MTVGDVREQVGAGRGGDLALARSREAFHSNTTYLPLLSPHLYSSRPFHAKDIDINTYREHLDRRNYFLLYYNIDTKNYNRIMTKITTKNIY